MFIVYVKHYIYVHLIYEHVSNFKMPLDYKQKYGSGGIRTHASEDTGALNQRLRPSVTIPPIMIK